MDQVPAQQSGDYEQPPKLSICISTLNRADFLRAALDRILPQLTEDCEVVVVDNASVDGTEQMIAQQMGCSSRLRYVRKDTNEGFDGNYDRAVELARGEYCWLMSDDDLIKPNAIALILKALQGEPSAVVVNYEFNDFSMSKVLHARAFAFDEDRVYGPWEADRMFVELGDCVRFVSAHVMRRAVWLSRQRDLYNGSSYGFVGMLFQARLPRYVHVIARPCVMYRFGNEGTFSSHLMEIMMTKWPSLVASLPLSDSTKRKLHSAQPWNHFYEMLRWRGSGFYSREQYVRWLRPQLRLARERFIPVVCARIPRSLANLLVTLYLLVRRNHLRDLRGLHLAVLRATSPRHLWSRGLRMRGKLRGALPADSG